MDFASWQDMRRGSRSANQGQGAGAPSSRRFQSRDAIGGPEFVSGKDGNVDLKGLFDNKKRWNDASRDRDNMMSAGGLNGSRLDPFGEKADSASRVRQVRKR